MFLLHTFVNLCQPRISLCVEDVTPVLTDSTCRKGGRREEGGCKVLSDVKGVWFKC
jgi:hypothetical protein